MFREEFVSILSVGVLEDGKGSYLHDMNSWQKWNCLVRKFRL